MNEIFEIRANMLPDFRHFQATDPSFATITKP